MWKNWRMIFAKFYMKHGQPEKALTFYEKWCTPKNKSREEIVYMKSKLLSGLPLVAVGFSFTQVIGHESHLENQADGTFHIAARNQT